MAWQGLATEFLQVPAVTRAYTAACVLTTAAVVSCPGRRGYLHGYSPGWGVSIVTVESYGQPLTRPWFRSSWSFSAPSSSTSTRISCSGSSRSGGSSPTSSSLDPWDSASSSTCSSCILRRKAPGGERDRGRGRPGASRRGKTDPTGWHFLYRRGRFRYCRMLEEGSFRGRTADFVFMFLFGGVLMILLGLLGSLFFLGQALTAMLVYVWSRRSPQVRVNFLGLLTFQAPFLPWALMGFSLLLGNSILVDLLGIAVGHIYYFLEDVFPNQPGGKRLLLTPGFLKLLLDAPEEDPNYLPLPEEQPRPLQQ
ncbi:hypothetical protein MC885_004677 [Smutsia gigantea]|nr:hypothetical protein MC885_004677 [Smutsia gigantea]